jgi:hypothetical protein
MISSGRCVFSINATNNVELACSLLPLIWYDLNNRHAHQVPLEHLPIITCYLYMKLWKYERTLTIFICWNILLQFYMLMLGLSRVNLFWFWVTVSFVQHVLVGCDAGAAYGVADSCGSGSWRGEVELEVARRDGAMAAWPGHAISILFSSTDVVVVWLGTSEFGGHMLSCISTRLTWRIHVCRVQSVVLLVCIAPELY